mgnify:CR=1 FL=1
MYIHAGIFTRERPAKKKKVDEHPVRTDQAHSTVAVHSYSTSLFHPTIFFFL